jgi:hypothetical protein
MGETTLSQVRGEWRNGKPHGICKFNSDKYEGVATFTNGIVEGGPMWMEHLASKKRFSYACMKAGKKQGHFKNYFEDTKKARIPNF